MATSLSSLNHVASLSGFSIGNRKLPVSDATISSGPLLGYRGGVFGRNPSRSFSQSSSSLSNQSDGPSLLHFVAQAALTASEAQPQNVTAPEGPPIGRIYHETYGCQMNINDMEIVLSIMKNAGYSEVVDVPENAEVIFINTCAIRDNAEQKVWQRLNYFWFLKRHWKSNEKILDADKMVDVVCGPDAYRDLPRLLEDVDSGQKGINTLLSLEETYADISPVRISKINQCFCFCYEGVATICAHFALFLLQEAESDTPSPHPKDFPDELLYIMRDRHNIVTLSICLPQTGSSTVLERMRRGYTREAYLDLVQKIRRIFQIWASAVISYVGFHGEKTHANRNYDDDVPEEVKQRRLTELIEAFRASTDRDNDSNEERNPKVGDYVEVRILKSTRASLYGEAIAISKLSSFYNIVNEEAVACASS
ncbi:hypothetical protein M0R45_004053 [Rubus argutus]|uniref:MTTase N-terminal domain-containing protein n=1 Tax=Rubus argutus TaxID=59490 RepID=A0AAW1YII5_RUBAR